MKVFKNVRGSMDRVLEIEVNVDTVYVRDNIKMVNEEDFKGWEYDEIQYGKDEYIEKEMTEMEDVKMAMQILLGGEK